MEDKINIIGHRSGEEIIRDEVSDLPGDNLFVDSWMDGEHTQFQFATDIRMLHVIGSPYGYNNAAYWLDGYKAGLQNSADIAVGKSITDRVIRDFSHEE